MAGLAALGVQSVTRAADTLSGDAARLQHSLETLSTFGRPPGGSFASGVTRIGYSDADIQGRNFAMDLMRDAGIDPRIDAAGNIFGKYAGTRDLAPVLFGSHIDSVPEGGNFDGDLGSMAAIEIVRTLNSRNIRTYRPLEVVIWSCEESTFNSRSLNGSRAAVGALNPGELDEQSGGLTKREAIRRIGGNPGLLTAPLIKKGDYRAYVELHIEQGGTLERDGVAIGIVDGIVATDRYGVEITGDANHAGTTPMAQRKDALVAAAQMILSVRELVMAEPGRQVGTVGHIENDPNAPNVIPGHTSLTVELRDLSPEKLERIAARIRARAEQIATDTGTRIEVHPAAHNPPALADPVVQAAIESAARQMDLHFERLPSGAGHDAEMMAEICPMGMIFVPSIDGISHSPREKTSWGDCANGMNVLLHTVLQLAAA